MKTYIRLVSILGLGCLILNAAPVSETIARSTARNLLLAGRAKQAAGTALACKTVGGPGGTVSYRIISDTVSGNGWAVVAGDDRFRPVLGYSRKGQADDMPPPVRAWLEGYRQQMAAALQSGLPDRSARYKAAAVAADSAGPLVKSEWGQGTWFNADCPYDSTESTRTRVGCAAVAMAQVMRYWSYPPSGAGFHSYFHDVYGTINADFSAAQYDWAAMPYEPVGFYEDVTRLVYHCGVSVEMNYGPAASSAYLLADRSPTENCAEFALAEYFGYLPQVRGVRREAYSDIEWETLIRAEIDSGQPVIYAGFSASGGHGFICDGYDRGGLFHMNWGWSGSYDGWFALSALEPDDDDNYNERHQAVIGIRPPAGFAAYELGLYQSVTAPLTVLGYGDAFKVETDVSNRGTAEFTGDFCAALFDMHGVFKTYSQVRTGLSLGSDQHFTTGIDFVFEDSWQTLPGTYKAFTYYRPDGSETGWQRLFTDKQLSVRESVVVVVAESSAIELYEPMDVKSGTPAVSGEPFEVWLDAANYTDSAFAGGFYLGVFNAGDGNYAGLVELKTDMTLSAMSHYIPGLTFSTDSLEVPPGSYLLALKFRHGTDGEWQLAGSRIESNPIALTVLGPPIGPDSCEMNDSAATAYDVAPVFTGDTAAVTIGAGIHSGTDLDFYRIIFPVGYRYDADIRVDDAVTADSGENLTVDAQIVWSKDGEVWSAPYDNALPDSSPFAAGDTLLLQVAPIFAGMTGTYRLEVDLARVPEIGILMPPVFVEALQAGDGVMMDVQGRIVPENGKVPGGVYLRKNGSGLEKILVVE